MRRLTSFHKVLFDIVIARSYFYMPNIFWAEIRFLGGFAEDGGVGSNRALEGVRTYIYLFFNIITYLF